MFTKYFSSILKLHRLLRFEYALAFARIFQDTVNSSFVVFSSLSSVSSRFFSCLNDIWWLRHLVLNSVAVRPTYASFSSRVVTVAWYTISLCRHSPCNGQSFLVVQSLRLDLVRVDWLSLRWLYCAAKSDTLFERKRCMILIG